MPNYSYTNMQYTNMCICYSESDFNLRAAADLFMSRYGVRASERTILGAVQRLRDFDNFRPSASDSGTSSLPVEVEEGILDFFFIRRLFTE